VGVAGDALTGDESVELPEFDAPPADPVALVASWLRDARAHGVREPGSATLSTADLAGHVTARTVSLKGVTAAGVLFGTSTVSLKAHQLAENPRAALTLYWRETLQQLKVEGVVELGDDAESDALFYDRPRDAQAATAVSRQGWRLEDEDALAERAAELAASAERIPRPEDWRAHVLVPDVVEFWHGRTNRLHRRLRYELVEGEWTAWRVQP